MRVTSRGGVHVELDADRLVTDRDALEPCPGDELEADLLAPGQHAPQGSAEGPERQVGVRAAEVEVPLGGAVGGEHLAQQRDLLGWVAQVGGVAPARR